MASVNLLHLGYFFAQNIVNKHSKVCNISQLNVCIYAKYRSLFDNYLVN